MNILFHVVIPGRAGILKNSKNLVKTRKNKTKFPCIGFKDNKYFARIQINGKRIYLGSWQTPEQAYAEYRKFKSKITPLSF